MELTVNLLDATSSDEVLEAMAHIHFMKSLALDVQSLALVLDLKSLTIGCRIITLLFVIIQWNRTRELEQKNVCIYIVTYLDQVQVLL